MDVEYLLEMCHEDEDFLRDFMAQPVPGAATAATERVAVRWLQALKSHRSFFLRPRPW